MKGATNRVLSIWSHGRNVAVISTTSDKVLEELKEWANKKGYRIVEGALDES